MTLVALSILMEINLWSNDLWQQKKYYTAPWNMVFWHLLDYGIHKVEVTIEGLSLYIYLLTRRK